MKKTTRIVTGALVVGTTAGLLMSVFGNNGPLYRTEVLKLPINLQSPTAHNAAFTVDRSEVYMIEIHLNSIFSEEKMDKILGDYVAGGGGEINVSWEVKNNGIFIAHGSNAEFGYSPIWGGGLSGLTIGTINAEKGQVYALSISTKNVSTDWNLAEPYIEVGLHPNKLESYLALQVFGLIVTSVFGMLLVIVALLHFVGKRHAASNTASLPTPKSGEQNRGRLE